jgi:dTDP-4-dehydrorhamnose reductase
VVHYSTDYVFDGQKPVGQAYTPDDPVNPQSVYGRTKQAGEQLLLGSGVQALVFRTSWVFSDHGANFLKTMLRLAQERETLKVVADQHGAPTSAAFIAQATLDILGRWPTSEPEHPEHPTYPTYPTRPTYSTPHQPTNTTSALQSHDRHARVYHLTAAGQTTWHAFACALIAQARTLRPDLSWKILADTQIQPITTADYNAPAARPQNSLLDCSATEQDFGISRSTWQAQMKQVLTRLLA